MIITRKKARAGEGRNQETEKRRRLECVKNKYLKKLCLVFTNVKNDEEADQSNCGNG